MAEARMAEWRAKVRLRRLRLRVKLAARQGVLLFSPELAVEEMREALAVKRYGGLARFEAQR